MMDVESVLKYINVYKIGKYTIKKFLIPNLKFICLFYVQSKFID
jgi:hypothetical protein